MLSSKTKRAIALLLLMLVLGGCAYGRYVEQGDKAYAEGNYDAAIRAYEQALEEDPEGEEASAGLEQSRRALAGEFADEAEAALEKGDWIGAVVAASRAHRELPENREVARIVQDVASAVASKANALEESGDFANAFLLIRSVADSLPPATAKYGPRADAVRDRWVEHLVEEGSAARQSGQYGSALLYYAKAASLKPDPGLGGERDELRRELLEEWKYVAAVIPMDDRAKTATGSLRQRVEGTALRLEVVENARKAGEPDAVVEFRVDRPGSDVDISTRTESVRYQSGTEQVPNPAYERRLDDLEREQRELTRTENDITKLEQDLARYQDQVAREGPSPNTSTGAEQNVSRAQSRLERERDDLIRQRRQVQRARERLADEPQTIEEPVYSTLDYPVETHTLEVRSTAQIDLAHPDGREAIAVSTPVVASASDETHGGYTVADVAADPLNLPRARDLYPALWGRAAQVAGGAVEQSFSGWRKTLLERAEAEVDDAKKTDLLAIYLVTDPRNVDPVAPRELKALTGIPDAVAALTPGG